MRKPKKYLYLIAGLFLLAGCEKPEIKELKRLCALDGGQKIYETAYADGYFDATENGALVYASLATLNPTNIGGDTNYKYIEFCRDKATDQYDVGLKLGAGCWRASKVLRSVGHCDASADEQIKKAVISPFVEFIKDSCISVEKIDKQTTRFRIDLKTKKWIDEKSKFNFSRGDQYITDTNDGKIISRNITYMAVKGDVSYTCGSPQIINSHKNAPYKQKLLTNTILMKK